MSKYTVYCHISPSRKMYIGITMNDVKKRWMNGYGYKKCPRFYNAIKKYGWDNFQHIVLETGLSKQEAEAEEIRLIKKYGTTDTEYGYNIENGGNVQGTHSEETKRKISEANKGRIVSEEAKERWRRTNALHGGIKGKSNPFYGRHHAQAVKDAQSDFMKGNQYFKGHHHSDEYKKMKSEQMKEIYKDGSPQSKEVICVDEKGNVVQRYRSLRQAAKAVGKSPGTMCYLIKNERFRNGLCWRYA